MTKETAALALALNLGANTGAGDAGVLRGQTLTLAHVLALAGAFSIRAHWLNLNHWTDWALALELAKTWSA
jgi:hypothetical protein